MNPFLLGLRTSVACEIIAGGLINNTIELLVLLLNCKKTRPPVSDQKFP